MPIPRPLSRALLGGALIGGGALAVVGGLAARGPGLIGIGLASVLAACTAAGIAREQPRAARASALEAAVWAAGGAAGTLLVVVGISTVAGGITAAVAVVAAVGLIVARMFRRPRGASATGAGTGKGARSADAGVLQLPVRPPPGRPAARTTLPPVATLTTRELGDEWLRTTAALGTRLAPAAREALVLRREEALDELERRDPAGFARWLAAGPSRGSDPAAFVHGGPGHPGSIADSDAA